MGREEAGELAAERELLRRAARRLEAARMGRDRAIQQALAGGMSLSDIASATGLSQTRVRQLVGTQAGRTAATRRRQTPSPARLSRVAPDCREFAEAVEEILLRRRSEAAVPGQQSFKDWTRDELCELAYSSYKAMLRGSVRRPPRRDIVLRIARHLDCTPTECDRLLTAARYETELPDPVGVELQAALHTVSNVVRGLPQPAYAVLRDWTVVEVNDVLLALLQLSRRDWGTIPPASRTVLHLLFDPSLPLRSRLEADVDGWDRLVRSSILLFKVDNRPYRDAAWYTALANRLRPLPGFAERWDTIVPDEPWTAGNGMTPHPSAVELRLPGPGGTAVRLRPMDAYLHRSGYPGIVMLLPAEQLDDHTEVVRHRSQDPSSKR